MGPCIQNMALVLAQETPCKDKKVKNQIKRQTGNPTTNYCKKTIENKSKWTKKSKEDSETLKYS
jgi:hypothetical protein